MVARAEDESTGYVLPNKTLIEIGKNLPNLCSLLFSKIGILVLILIFLTFEMNEATQMPVTAHKLHRVLKTKLPFIERNLDSVINIIRHAMQNAAEFEAAAQSLKEAHARSQAVSF